MFILMMIGFLISLPILFIFGIGSGAVNVPPAGAGEIPSVQDLAIFVEASNMFKNVPPWYILASTNYVESTYGQNPLVKRGLPNSAGAFGPMQFLAPTFEEYEVKTIGTDINSEKDAVFATANMYSQNIAKNGGWPVGLPDAIFDYNHSHKYVQQIENVAGYIVKNTPKKLIKRAEKEAHVFNEQHSTSTSARSKK